jgi:hypothetical protein
VDIILHFFLLAFPLSFFLSHSDEKNGDAAKVSRYTKCVLHSREEAVRGWGELFDCFEGKSRNKLF